MNKGLLIIGAGQYACVVEEIARELGYERIAFLDDKSERAIGSVSCLEQLCTEYECGVVAIGNSVVRRGLTKRLKDCGYTVPALIHPSAYVSPSSVIGCGVIVEPNATVQANVIVGEGTFVSSGAVLRHNAVVGEFCHCDCGSVVMSGAVVDELTRVECNRVLQNQ